MRDTYQKLNKLQELRPDVPMYVYFGAIRATQFIKVQKDLMKLEGRQKEVDIILESPGGQTDYGYRLVRTFRKKFDTVNIIVPSWAKSAATLFAFGANKLVLHEYGELGPIDTQIRKEVETDPQGEWSSAVNVQTTLREIEEQSKNGVLDTFRKLRHDAGEDNEEVLKIGRTPLMGMLLDYSAKLYEPLMSNIRVEELGKNARNLTEGMMYAKRILLEYGGMQGEKADELIKFLTYECPDHGYVVDYELLQPYLPNVIKSNEAPFGPEYDKELEKLSVRLMVPEYDKWVIGFLRDLLPRDLTPKSPSATIQTNGQQPSNPTTGTPAPTSQTGGPSTRPLPNLGTGNPSGNNQGNPN